MSGEWEEHAAPALLGPGSGSFQGAAVGDSQRRVQHGVAALGKVPCLDSASPFHRSALHMVVEGPVKNPRPMAFAVLLKSLPTPLPHLVVDNETLRWATWPYMPPIPTACQTTY